MPVNVPVQEQIDLSSGILTRAYEAYMAGERLSVEERSAVNKAIGDPVISTDPNESGRDRYSIRGGPDNIFAPLLPDRSTSMPASSPSPSEPSTDSSGSSDGPDPAPTSGGSSPGDVGDGSGSDPGPDREGTGRPTSSSGGGRTRAIVLTVLAIGTAVAWGWS